MEQENSLITVRGAKLLTTDRMQTQTAPNPTRGLHLSTSSGLAIVLLAIIFFGTIRFRVRDMPLERDEGEYAYSGQLMLQGIPPYKLAYNMKLPGIYLAYAAMLAAFGETPAGIHLGLIFVNAAAVLLVFFLTSTLFGRLAAMVAACSYALLSTSTSVMGFEAHATNFVVVAALVAILFLLAALRSKRWWMFFLSGLCAGVAVEMKQHGIFFALFCLSYLTVSEWKRATGTKTIVRWTAIFALGVVLPYAVTCWLLYRDGVFREFWVWTVSYAGEYSKVGLHRAVRALGENFAAVVRPALPLWILAAVGASALFWSAGARKHSRFIALLFLFSFLSLCPGAFFRPHYFVLLLPVIAILVGVGVSAVTQALTGHSWYSRFALVPVVIFVLAFAYGLVAQRQVYFSMTPDEIVQATYGENAFIPAVQVADYIRKNSPEEARIAVFGSEPEIYFYAHRHSATGYLYMYSLIGHQKYIDRMREEFKREVEVNRPEYLVYVDILDSWGERDGVPGASGFLAWMEEYKDQNYERAGVADIGGQTRYVWGDAAKTYVPESSEVIYVLKRK